MVGWIQQGTPGQQGFYQVQQVRDLSVFPCKRYQARVVLGPGDPAKQIPTVAAELSNAIRALGYHPTLKARAAYHQREADEVLVCYYSDLRDLSRNNPCGRTIWSEEASRRAGPIHRVDERVAPGVDLEWHANHEVLRRCMDREEDPSGRWVEEGPQLREEASRTIDDAGHIYSAYNRGMLSWQTLEHRLGELRGWLQVAAERFGEMPAPSPRMEHAVGSLERFLISAQGILLPFAPWARGTTDPEDLSWFLEDAFAQLHELEARVTEEWSHPR